MSRSIRRNEGQCDYISDDYSLFSTILGIEEFVYTHGRRIERILQESYNCVFFIADLTRNLYNRNLFIIFKVAQTAIPFEKKFIPKI